MLALAIGFCAAMLPAEELQYSRTLMSVGGSLTIGDRLEESNTGGGLFFKLMTYFDSSRPSGFCYGLFSGYCLHTVGGVNVVDTKLVTLGYRGLLTPWLGFEASLSPTIGARLTRDTVEGSYLGIGPSIGIFVPVNESIDISLSFEPVLNLMTLDGKTAAKNKSYSDLALCITLKNYAQIKPLPWQ